MDKNFVFIPAAQDWVQFSEKAENAETVKRVAKSDITNMHSGTCQAFVFLDAEIAQTLAIALTFADVEHELLEASEYFDRISSGDAFEDSIIDGFK